METEATEVPQDSHLVTCWRIEGHNVAMRADQVLEIVQIEEVTYLPSDDPRILGLVALRGGLIPVFSLAQELGLRADWQSLWPPFPAVLVSLVGTTVAVPSDSLPHIERTDGELVTHLMLMEIAGEVRTVLDAAEISASYESHFEQDSTTARGVPPVSAMTSASATQE